MELSDARFKEMDEWVFQKLLLVPIEERPSEDDFERFFRHGQQKRSKEDEALEEIFRQFNGKFTAFEVIAYFLRKRREATIAQEALIEAQVKLAEGKE